MEGLRMYKSVRVGLKVKMEVKMRVKIRVKMRVKMRVTEGDCAGEGLRVEG